MRLPHRLACVLFAVLVATSVATPAIAGDDVWITIERGVARYGETGLAAAGFPGALVVMDAGSADSLSFAARATDVVVARVDRRAFDILPEILHAVVRHGPGLVYHATREDAEAVAARVNTQFIRRTPEPPIPYTIDNGPVVQALMAPLQEVNVRNTITALGAFFTRHRNCPTGLDSALWIRDTWLALATGRADVTVEFFNHTTTPQPSVILTIAGTTLPSEVVVLGGHRDSTAGSNCTTSRSPGEDDDASGIANMTEVIRVAMALNYRPERTVKFMAYAGEEGGLLGSNEIATAYANQGVNVVGMLNLDMTNYQGSSGDVYIFTTQTNAAQNAFIGSLLDVYLPTLVHQLSTGCSGCSDHVSWTNRGFPASFPFESTIGQSNPFIHTANDTIAQSGGNANHALKFTRLAAAYLAEAAKGGFPANQAPVANAGPDHPASPVVTYLDGRASFDPDAGPSQLTYAWTQLSGPRVTIRDASSALARFSTPYLRSTCVFRLTVSDGFRTATDDVTVIPRTEP